MDDLIDEKYWYVPILIYWVVVAIVFYILKGWL